MKLKHWNYLEQKHVPTPHTLSYLLTVKMKYTLISFLKPKEEWRRVDLLKEKIGIPVTIDVAMNHGQVMDVTYIRNPNTDEGWYLKRESTTFEKFSSDFKGFSDWDKTSGNRYIFEGTFEEFVQALKDEGFTFEENK